MSYRGRPYKFLQKPDKAVKDDSGSSSSKYGNVFSYSSDVPLAGSVGGIDTFGPPGNEYHIKKGQQRKIAKHRTTPITYQGHVVLIADVPRPNVIYSEREVVANGSGGADLIAPLGNEECFVIQKGELVYSLSRTGERQTTANGGGPTVFSAVNGLPITADIKFEGFMQFNQLKKDNPDPVGTIACAGTVSTLNTGPGRICAGQMVYFSKFPAVIRDSAGRIAPYLRVIGDPGHYGDERDFSNNTSIAKFYPAVYGIENQNTGTYFHRLKRLINGNWNTEIGNNNQIDYPNVATSIEENLKQREFMKVARDLPAMAYAIMYIWLKGYLLALAKDISGAAAEGIGKQLYKKIKQHFSTIKTKTKLFIESKGTKQVEYDHDSLLEETQTNIENWGNAKYARIYDYKILLIEWSYQLLEYLKSAHDDYLRSHTIGTCLKDSESGETLDILVGYSART